MKRYVIGIFLMAGLVAQAQDAAFGITGGFLNAEGRVKFEGITVSGSEAGFYIGLLADFTVEEQFHIQPELLYASADEADALIIPILAKYYVASKFNLQAGPQLGISLEEKEEDLSNFGLGIAAGLGYDITSNFLLEGRYSFQLNNSYTGSEDVKARIGYLTLGVGYTF